MGEDSGEEGHVTRSKGKKNLTSQKQQRGRWGQRQIQGVYQVLITSDGVASKCDLVRDYRMDVCLKWVSHPCDGVEVHDRLYKIARGSAHGSCNTENYIYIFFIHAKLALHIISCKMTGVSSAIHTRTGADYVWKEKDQGKEHLEQRV